MSGLTGRALVIDYDYFFPNPAMTPRREEPEAFVFYDWATNESAILIGPIWQTRAAGFLSQDKELPRCNEDYERFWERFTFTDNGMPLLACDSNMHAGRLWPALYGLEGDGWEQVHLYDAHHDCGYTGEDETAWEATGRFGCADWMRLHHQRGSDLRVHYPPWRAADGGGVYDCERPPAVPVTRGIDDGRPVPEPFDAVLVCRSGAWVPSWCDDQFEAFLQAAPLEVMWIEDRVERERGFDEALARREVQMIAQMRAQLG